MATLQTSASDDGQAVLNGVREGSTFIVVEAKDFGIRLINVNVTDPNKMDNTLKVKGKTAKVGASKLKKSSKTLPVKKVIKFVNKGQGKLSYHKVSGNEKITMNETTGRVTVKKGLKKGTYKVTVLVKAAGNKQYKPSEEKKVTFRIKVTS